MIGVCSVGHNAFEKGHNDAKMQVIILYINTLSWGAMYASAGYSLRTTSTSSLSIDAVCLSHCYKVFSDPIW